MSGRRSRSRHASGQYPSSGGGASTISEEQIRELVSKLQQLLPELHARRRSDRVSAAKVLQETCNYIQSLQREVDNLSERLGELLETNDSAEAALIRSLLSQQR